MRQTLRQLLILSACSLLLGACAPAGPRPLGDPQNPYPLTAPPKVGEFVHLPTGLAVSSEQLLAIAGDARIVYFGETHDNPASHRLETMLLAGLDKRHPGKMALGLEMFSRSQQPVLDRWVAGELSEKEFLKESRWFEEWRFDFSYYRELLNLARERQIPVIALNAEKSLVRAIRGKSLEELTPEERAQLPEFDYGDPYQRAQTLAILGDHSHGKLSADGFVRAQTLWDETMAESVARYLNSPAGENRHMLVCAGGNHIRYGFGIPRRVFRRLPSSYTLIGGREIVIPEEKKDRLMDVELPTFPMVPYDFLAFFAYESLPQQGVRLGVMIEPAPDGKGLLVTLVQPGSNAEKAGIRKDDRLLAIDGEALGDNFDLVYAVQQKQAGERGELQVERGGERLQVEVEFAATPTGHPAR
ncbi:hypothetical protein JCM30471_15870 [Desulfuromonas carbonis]|uniref:ChaN family lipoprotein n=1 Tax=Desulfuromonas sp. DDH964 TaxID=1823759 RepID=UPI00078D93B6|nr:ChaN family lipoprotein [Desulfuromonas sp. DDH964]AMV73178.1 hypothetical protein DBW_2869 [Desulfuromonas sp. DDH964]